jgi:hypothetical protein
MPARSGGGIRSKVVSETKAFKTEPTVHNIDPTRPSQIGMSVHYVKSDLYQSSTTPKGPNPPVAGVGGGRMILKSGSQGQHGSAVSGTARPGANKPIFPGFK